MSIKIRKEDGKFITLPNIKGDVGPQGIQGPMGLNGATFTPNVDNDGNLSWSNDKDLSNPTTVNIKGPKGDKGDTGDSIGDINITTGIEYETGKIIDGKKEYAIRIDCGALPATSTKQIDTGLPDIYTITDYHAIAYWNAMGLNIPIKLPYIGGAKGMGSIGTMETIYFDIQKKLTGGNFIILIQTTADAAEMARNSYVTISYTKNE